MAEAEVLVGGVPSHDLEFRDMRVSIGEKQILKGLSFTVRAHRTCAFMGATGSGKTTLMNCLAGRMQYKGTVRYGGQPWSSSLRNKIAFIEQEDLVYSCLTVRESLQLSARLRLPKRLTHEEKMQRVEEIIVQFRMGKCADTRIGDANVRGISGGEKKRLCIATEILTDPHYVFCDEPTSGLDSTTAVTVVQSLRQLADQGKTVISSIHQPSYPIFAMFDDLFFLHEGEMVFRGPARDVVPFFSALGYDCPKLHNPADFLMDLFVLDQISAEAVAKIRAGMGAEDTPASDSSPVKGDHVISEKTSYPATFWTQMAVVVKRAHAQTKGEIITVSSTLMYLGLAVLNGFLWFTLPALEGKIYDRFALSLFLGGTWMFFPIFEALAIFPQDRVMLRKELYVGSFRLSAYFLGRTTVCLLPYLLWPLLSNLVIYWMTIGTIGPAGSSVVQFLCIHFSVLLSLLSMHSIGLLAGAAVPQKHLTTFVILFVTFAFTYSGLFNATLVWWLHWVNKVNPFVYGYQLIAYCVFAGPGSQYVRHACKPSLSDFPACRAGAVDSVTGPEVLAKFGPLNSPEVCVAVCVGVFVVGRVLAFLVLRVKLLGAKVVE